MLDAALDLVFKELLKRKFGVSRLSASGFVVLSVLGFTAVTAAAADSSYRGVSVNLTTNALQVKQSASIRSRTPDNHSRIWDIYDGDRKIDQVMSLNGKFMEWHTYKVLGRAIVGDLVAHQRYSSKFPTRYPWIDFGIAQLQADGEKPALAPASAIANLKSECTYIIYVFRSGDLVEAAYDAKGGVLGRCGMFGQDGINTITFGAKEMNENFSKYGIPEKIAQDTKTVVINPVMKAGLNKVDFLPLPNKAQLDHVFLIRQYDQARLFDVTTFDLHGKKISNQLCKFSSRPLDGSMSKLFKAGG
jgi:hypothetical protein